MNTRVAPTRPRRATAAGSFDLATYLRVAARDVPDRIAVIGDDGAEVDYATLARWAARAAAVLHRHRVTAGDVVAIQAPNVIDTVVWTWAAWQSGAVVCPIVTIYREREVGFIVAQCAPRVMVTMDEYRGCRHLDLATTCVRQAGLDTSVVELGAFHDHDGTTQPDVRRDPDAAALLLYTSGTTSDPKGVIHSASTLVHEALSIADVARLVPGGVAFMASPLTHVTGLLYCILLPVLTRGTCVLQERWHPQRAAELVDRYECNLTVGATPFLRGMVDALRERPALRPVDVFICGGADIPPRLIHDAWDVGMRAVRTYGSTEMPTATIGDPFGNPHELHLDEGHPIGDVELRVVEADDDRPADPIPDGQIGELEVRGPELFLGYLDAALNAAFTDDGYFRTGDLARVTERGTLQICGRKKDLINRGGEKFSARDIEDVLMEHPAIREIAVVGVPDPTMVERACAFVVAEIDTEPKALDVAALAAFVTARGYPIQKAPEHVRVVDELPRTASGKVRKFELQATFDASDRPAAR